MDIIIKLKTNKKGYTLIELIAVIILLGIIGLISVPVVSNLMKEGKEDSFQAVLEEVKIGTEKWAYQNSSLLPIIDEQSITVNLLELKKTGCINLNIKDPRTNILLPDDMNIIITLKNGKYMYYVDGNSGSQIGSEYNDNAPTLILNGSSIEYVEFGDQYKELGAISKDNSGVNVAANVTYQDNGIQISSIDTNIFKTYTVIYSASSNGYTSRIVRTVIVRDTTPPELIIPDNIELTQSQSTTFDINEGVSVTDNSEEQISVQTSGYKNSVGQHIVSYSACDSRDNCVTKKRIVNIIP